MKNVFLLLFLAISAPAIAQIGDCSKFKNGKFIIYSEEFGNSILERKGSKQVETMEKTGEKSIVKVKWVDECTYVLSHSKKNPGKIPGMVIKVQMTEIREKSYMARISTNMFSETMIIEIFKLE